MKLETILIATDFSDPSRAALQLATSLAADRGARLLIVHVESPDIIYGGDELDLVVHPIESPIARQLLDKTTPTSPAVRYERHLLTGLPADEIVRFATESQVDLIVIGTHGRTGARRWLQGSVAEAIIRHAPCPVLTVKATPAAEASGAEEQEQ